MQFRSLRWKKGILINTIKRQRSLGSSFQIYKTSYVVSRYFGTVFDLFWTPEWVVREKGRILRLLLLFQFMSLFLKDRDCYLPIYLAHLSKTFDVTCRLACSDISMCVWFFQYFWHYLTGNRSHSGRYHRKPASHYYCKKNTPRLHYQVFRLLIMCRDVNRSINNSSGSGFYTCSWMSAVSPKSDKMYMHMLSTYNWDTDFCSISNHAYKTYALVFAFCTCVELPLNVHGNYFIAINR